MRCIATKITKEYIGKDNKNRRFLVLINRTGEWKDFKGVTIPEWCVVVGIRENDDLNIPHALNHVYLPNTIFPIELSKAFMMEIAKECISWEDFKNLTCNGCAESDVSNVSTCLFKEAVETLVPDIAQIVNSNINEIISVTKPKKKVPIMVRVDDEETMVSIPDLISKCSIKRIYPNDKWDFRNLVVLPENPGIEITKVLQFNEVDGQVTEIFLTIERSLLLGCFDEDITF
jgi:hypothetical protein